MDAKRFRGTVCQILCKSPFGGSIFRVTCKEYLRPIRVVASKNVMNEAPPLGGCITIEGHFENSDYGTQFSANTATLVVPEASEIIELFSRHYFFVSINRRVASRLWRAMKCGLYEALNKADMAALVRHRVPRQIALEIVHGWDSYCLRCKVETFFNQHQIPVKLMDEVLILWGKEALQQISDDPYCLSPLVPWKQMDQIGMDSFQVEKHAGTRLLGAAKSLMAHMVKNGSPVIAFSSFKGLLKERLGDVECANKAIALAIERRHVTKIDTAQGCYLQPSSISRIEENIGLRLCAGLDDRDSTHIVSSSASSIREVATVPGEIGANSAARLFSIIKQERKCLVTIDCRFSRWIIQGLLAEFPSALHVISSQALRDTVFGENGCNTVLLKDLLIAPKLDSTTSTPDICFVHDAHTLDTLTLNKILLAVPEESRLCIFGNPILSFPRWIGEPFFQLSRSNLVQRISITVSNVPRSPEQKSVMLRAHRQEQTRLGLTLDLDSQLEVEWFDGDTTLGIVGTGLAYYRSATEKSDAIILTATQKLANIINDALHMEMLELRNMRQQTTPQLKVRRQRNVTIGDKIVVRTSDYSRCLLSGDRGVITDIFEQGDAPSSNLGGHLAAVAAAYFGIAGHVELTEHDLFCLDLGYASPLSRIFPSIWDDCIAIVENCRLVDRTWLEQAKSLSAKRVMFVGDREAFHAAFGRQPAIRHKPSYFYRCSANLPSIDVTTADTTNESQHA